MHKLVAVLGPTGSGKTALAEALALRFHGELVSCDAKQVYRGMDIGTNKEKELRVPQHLIDIKNPGEKITVAEYQALAYQVIDELHGQHKLPILVGVAMLYAEAVMNGYVFKEGEKSNEQRPRYEVLKLGIKMEDEELRQRIAKRTEEWLKAGLLEEIQSLLERGVSTEWLYECGQEYRFFSQHLLGELTLDEAIEKTNISLNQYRKRQYTWWRRHNDVHWVQSQKEAEALVAGFLQA